MSFNASTQQNNRVERSIVNVAPTIKEGEVKAGMKRTRFNNATSSSETPASKKHITAKRSIIGLKTPSANDIDKIIPFAKQSKSSHVHTGAVADETAGAVGIYFAEGDPNNFGEVFHHAHTAHDLDYAYVLATLKIMQFLQSVDHAPTSIIINTSCRDLPRALAGKSKFTHNLDLINKIRALMDESKDDVTVRFISGRSTSPGYKAAIAIANGVLNEHKLSVVDDLLISNSTHSNPTAPNQLPSVCSEKETPSSTHNEVMPPNLKRSSSTLQLATTLTFDDETSERANLQTPSGDTGKETNNIHSNGKSTVNRMEIDVYTKLGLSKLVRSLWTTD